MEEITSAQFDEMLAKQNQYSTKKWTDLEKNKIYTITETKIIDTQNGESMILSLLENGEVWAPNHLKEKIEKTDSKPPFYIRPTGLKSCKNNKKNKYHSYDLIINK